MSRITRNGLFIRFRVQPIFNIVCVVDDLDPVYWSTCLNEVATKTFKKRPSNLEYSPDYDKKPASQILLEKGVSKSLHLLFWGVGRAEDPPSC